MERSLVSSFSIISTIVKVSDFLLHLNFKFFHPPFSFLSDPSPIIGYACQRLTDSLTPWCLVDLMAVNDANCLMMSQQLLNVCLRHKELCKMLGILLNKKFLRAGQIVWLRF